MRYFPIQNMVYVLYDIPAVVNQCKPESVIPTHAMIKGPIKLFDQI
jgi:hypothetical protein